MSTGARTRESRTIGQWKDGDEFGYVEIAIVEDPVLVFRQVVPTCCFRCFCFQSSIPLW